jgi:hypothetical protein
MTNRQEVEAILAGARAEHRALLEHVSPALRASLPVDATGITQAIDHLAEAAGIEDVHGAMASGHRTNAAVLHMRVFGREPLARETVLAAYADGARVRAETLTALARDVGGDALATEVSALVEGGARSGAAAEPGDDVATVRLRALYAAHEQATVVIADYLDAA